MEISEKKQQGRLAALQIVSKLKSKPEQVQLDTDPIVEAIQKAARDPVDLTPLLEVLAENKPDTLDISPLVAAISALKLDTTVNFKPVALQLAALAKRPTADLTPVVDKLNEIKNALEENNKVLSDLVAVAKMSKVVEYDQMGRITKINVQTGE